ncbi:sigma-70 family RNA polymerase sigma factor (plasmid) [Trichormus variabilis ARAD]|nr:sigma-70 family RNA polymerase sigma factor [Trichormus variabilis ARAD]MBC1259599.1 sigma-70 family RNA polymerase sigma factor [Trichormus variabilis V5]MBC1271016.1 sigma-70 family RNA polymerase sigma factor [Trichormus variabilis FSR]MBC1306029.1 sigma-70 family RNA polymerase sigma factor [Trichormus variabilis N2B]MBC1314987.1 sigma-70 family RNA polymerase sigma factor [Trichormus variabilis PNB]MBC1330252.1 sigma-70 family RNA polymerase sigma factor [Trichormus variabilis 9RC]MBD
MDEQNLYLQAFIQEACSHLPNSPQRRKALNSILRGVLKSPCTWKGVGDLYEEALVETMMFVSEKLCEKYDPKRGLFWHWFNACLRNKYKDKIRAVQRDYSHKYTGELNLLDQVISGVDATLLLDTWESFVQWIEDNPDNILSDCHIRNNPRANCQSLAYLRIVLGKEWEEIAASVGSTRGAVTSHWCRKCEPLLREWLDTNHSFFGEDNYG